MEDALISPAGFMILSGAGLIEASKSEPIIVHRTEQTDQVEVTGNTVKITLNDNPYQGKDVTDYSKRTEDLIYVMLMENGEVVSEPYTEMTIAENVLTLTVGTDGEDSDEKQDLVYEGTKGFTSGCVVLVDYYVEKESNTQQIDITPDKFGGNYYLEASTLWRGSDGVDHPAEFIIPNCKIQSNFTFTMASSGDPSTFTFTMDAFPDYTRFNKTKKVQAAIQIISEGAGDANLKREGYTKHQAAHDVYFD